MTVLERFIAKVSFEGCWVWEASIDKDGYGHFWERRGKVQQAHRWAYQYWNGPLDIGLSIDHLCRNRACVNPSHLEQVPQHENARRGLAGELKTHCAKGHPFDEVNTYYRPPRGTGRRTCRLCNRAAAAALKRRKQEAV